MRLHELTAIKEASSTPAMQAVRWYHGTSNLAAAESILGAGIQPDRLRPDQVKRTTRGKLDPVAGRVYITSSLEYGVLYALGGVFAGHAYDERFMGKTGRYGFLFVVDGRELAGDIQPDEDSVGGFMADHTELGWDRSATPWRRLPPAFKPDGVDDAAKRRVWSNIRDRMTPRQARDADEGFIAAQASGGKRALKTLPVRDMLDLIAWGAHVAHQGGVKPAECWRIDKSRCQEVAENASNFFEIAERIA